jgi:hypothetical protein
MRYPLATPAMSCKTYNHKVLVFEYDQQSQRVDRQWLMHALRVLFSQHQ